MDWVILAAGAGALAIVALAIAAPFFAPARTAVLIDTTGGAARAEMKTLWGVGPTWTWRLLPQEMAGAPLAPFNDPAHIGHALMTPGIADVTYGALKRIAALNPRAARFALGLHLTDSGQNRVVQTAVQAVLATAPPAMRQMINVSALDLPGAEVSARFDLDVSPARLKAIYRRFSNTKAVREFRKRLKRKPKPGKKAPREVQA